MTNTERKTWLPILRLESNPVIKTLTISEIFIVSGFGLLNPIFAVYLTSQIEGGNLAVVGLAATIYLLTKSLGQLMSGQIIDAVKGERDDFTVMMIGSIGISIVPLLYLFARLPSHIYLIQFFYGLSQALIFPSWLAIFTRHIDPGRAGIEWGIYYTLIDLFGAAVATVGGVIAYYLGFTPLLILVSIFSFIGSGWLLMAKDRMRKR